MQRALARWALWALLAAVLMTANAPRGFAGNLVSVGFTDACTSWAGPYTGVEPLAQTANPTAFGSANYWNALGVGGTTCPSSALIPPFDNLTTLADSSGNPTSVGMSFGGATAGYYCPGGCAHSINGAFIYIDGGVLDWTLTGLTPGAKAYLYFYGYGATGQDYRTFHMALDTNGDSTLDTTNTVLSYTGVYGGEVLTSPAGTISGEMQYWAGQASWSGFQVDVAPEPSTLALFGIGMALVAIRRRRP